MLTKHCRSLLYLPSLPHFDLPFNVLSPPPTLHLLVVLLAVAQHPLVLLPGVGAARASDAELLHLLKLVDAEDAKGVTAVAASLLAEAGGVASVPAQRRGGRWGREEGEGWGRRGIHACLEQEAVKLHME